MRREAVGDADPWRRGSSYLEVQVAFAVLGVALAGLAPILVAQLRLIDRIEARLEPDKDHYLVPATNPWMRKLGAAATITTSDPGDLPDPTPTAGEARNVVAIEAIPAAGPGDTMAVTVLVTAIPAEPESGP